MSKEDDMDYPWSACTNIDVAPSNESVEKTMREELIRLIAMPGPWVRDKATKESGG